MADEDYRTSTVYQTRIALCKCVMAHQDKENEIEAAGRKLQIRNSTVDFLVFTKDAGEDGIEVRVQNHDVWLTQKAIAQLFDVDRSVVTKHL